MNIWTLLKRSFFYYRRTHLWVILGACLSTTILVGALITGDSIRTSLKTLIFQRLGKTEYVMNSGEHFFRSSLADRISLELNTQTAPLLATQGIVISQGGQNRINKVQIIGVDNRFWKIGGGQEFKSQLSQDEVIVNTHISNRLGVKKGDTLLLRIKNLDFMPTETALSLDTSTLITKRYTIKEIVSDKQFGRFSLKVEQTVPYNVFVSLDSLSEDLGLDSRANILLVSKESNQPLPFSRIEEALAKSWEPEDAGLEINQLSGQNNFEIKSNRVFINLSIYESSQRIDQNSRPVLTYFVNKLNSGNRSTPYSFVSTIGAIDTKMDLKEDEIIINSWLANDLYVKPEDEIKLSYYVLGEEQKLIEKQSIFKIKHIVPLDGIFVDKELMPDFPGLKEAESSRNWDPPLPLNLDLIRNKDEDYWKKYRGTPKAFVSFNSAKKMWGNRFGNLTSIRLKGSDQQTLSLRLKKELSPSLFGFTFINVKEAGLLSTQNSFNFSELFLGLSFFVIGAALMLTGMLFVLNTEQRSKENGLYLSLGFSPKKVRGIIFMEGAFLIIFGSLAGTITGIFYNQIILFGLKTIWRDIVGTSAIHIHFQVTTILLGLFAGIIVSLFAIWISMRNQGKKTITELQKGVIQSSSKHKNFPKKKLVFGIITFITSIIIIAQSGFESGRESFGFFFTAGSLFLISGLLFFNVLLFQMNKKKKRLRLFDIGIRNNTRKYSRSLITTAILATGLFIVFTVGSNRIDSTKNAQKRESGTGGFAFFGESTLPIHENLIDRSIGSVVKFRVKEGDDSSCLNLNRASTPRIIAVDPQILNNRNAFTFTGIFQKSERESPWFLLNKVQSDGSVPAIADNNVIVWGLGKSLGDTLDFIDEKGNKFKIKLVGSLANSIFQGNIIISEQEFKNKFPSTTGYRLFLIDAPFTQLGTISKDLSWKFQDKGLDLIPASTRLAEFNKVENTYLSIFLILGSLGLLIGSIGMGIIVWRNTKERRGEHALLKAVGYSMKSIQILILSEYSMLLIAGIFIGIVGALASSLPSLLSPGSEFPYLTILLLLILVITNGFIWIYLASLPASKEDIRPALRSE